MANVLGKYALYKIWFLANGLFRNHFYKHSQSNLHGKLNYKIVKLVFWTAKVIDKRFLEHLDLSYAVNTEKYEKHRALHLGTQGAAHANISLNVISKLIQYLYIQA